MILTNTRVLILVALSIAPVTSLAVGVGFIETIQAPDERPCYFFKLKGVQEASPVVKGSPWFAVAKTHQGYKEIVATVLTAFALKKQVYIGTTGAIAASCEHAEVSYVRVEDEPVEPN